MSKGTDRVKAAAIIGRRWITDGVDAEVNTNALALDLAEALATDRADLRAQVEAVATFVDECAEGRSPLAADAYRDIAARIRAAVAGTTTTNPNPT